MAAILCQSVSSLCRNVSSALCLPCQHCCRGLGAALTSPFLPYLVATFLLNVPPIIWGAQGSCSWLSGNALLCLVHIVASIYIVRRVRQEEEPVADTTVDATYTNMEEQNKPDASTKEKVTKAEPVKPTTFFTTTEETNGQPNSVQRLGRVMCYDAGVAVYLIVCLVWFGWQSRGLWIAVSDDEQCHQSHMQGSLLCGWVYLTVVGCAFGCSLVCLRRN